MSDKFSEALVEILLDHPNAEEGAAVNLKHRIAELVGVKEAVAVKEETFTVLNFEKQTGAKIGEFEVISKTNNIPEKFQRAFTILEKSNATISNRYHGEGYGFSYWMHECGERIFRQALKSK